MFLDHILVIKKAFIILKIITFKIQLCIYLGKYIKNNVAKKYFLNKTIFVKLSNALLNDMQY